MGWFILAAALVMLAVVSLPVGFGLLIHPACGCLATPTHPPGWTPWPVSDDRAADAASTLTGVDVRTWKYEITVSGRPVIEAQGVTAVAFVDADSGAVLAAVIKDQLPNSEAAAVDENASRNAAQSFLARGGISPTRLTEAANLIKRATVAFYDVTWSALGADKPRLDVLVNAESGAVFAFRDLTTGLELSVPIVGHMAAMRLAAASSAEHATPDPSNQPQPEFMGLGGYPGDPSGHDWSWDVSLPQRSVQVDAETGEVWTWN
jgi:hypothetical protein